jgi:addiction module HigA family antidote
MKKTIIHPGKILEKDFLINRKISINQLAKEIKVPNQHLAEICEGNADIDTNIAYRLATYFQNSVQFWLDLQRDYDLKY